MQRPLWLLALPALLFAGAASAADKEADAKQAKADLAAFKEYLGKNKLTRWQGDPTRLDSEELRAAYPKRRLYFTFAAPPLPPGAALPDLIEAHKRRMAEWQEKQSLRLVVLIDDDGKVAPLSKPEDFSAGLMPVKGEADAKTAAAAILSVANVEQVAPTAVSAKEVNVTKGEKGWTCTVSKKMAFDGSVTFDADGKCTKVEKRMNYIMPLPPSAPPRR